MPPLHFSTVLKTQTVTEDQQTSIQNIYDSLSNKLKYNRDLQNSDDQLVDCSIKLFNNRSFHKEEIPYPTSAAYSQQK